MLMLISQSPHQRGVAKFCGSIDVGAFLEQKRDNPLMAISRSAHQRGVLTPTGTIDVNAFLDQEPDNLICSVLVPEAPASAVQ